MPAQKLNPAERYSAIGELTVLFLPVIAAASKIPTRPEINGGTDLTTELNGAPSGFQDTGNEIEMPGLTRRVPKLPSTITYEDSSMGIYLDRGGDDARDIFQEGTEGFIVFMDGGDRTGGLMDIWPIRVKARPKVRSTDAATMLQPQFSIPSDPVLDATIPTAA